MTDTKVWFITGCSTGFGRELAKMVLDRGYRAVVTARDPAKVEDIAKGRDDRALVLELDVTDPVDAGGVAVLAHPRVAARGWTVPDDVIARLAAAGLSGIEVRHPDQDRSQRTELQALADRLGLVASGGSDDHGELTGYRIGSDTIAADAFERLVSQATGGTLVSGP